DHAVWVHPVRLGVHGVTHGEQRVGLDLGDARDDVGAFAAVATAGRILVGVVRFAVCFVEVDADGRAAVVDHTQGDVHGLGRRHAFDHGFAVPRRRDAAVHGIAGHAIGVSAERAVADGQAIHAEQRAFTRVQGELAHDGPLLAGHRDAHATDV